MKAITQTTWVPLGAALSAMLFLGGGVAWLNSIHASAAQSADAIKEIKDTRVKERDEVIKKLERLESKIDDINKFLRER